MTSEDFSVICLGQLLLRRDFKLKLFYTTLFSGTRSSCVSKVIKANMKSSIKRLPSKRDADEEKLPKKRLEKARVQYSFEFET